MKKNKKGFTLVELLAVIVVLAIIMIIAIPSVMESMNKARKNAFKIYAQKVLNTAMTKYQADMLTGGTSSTNCYTLTALMKQGTGNYKGRVVIVSNNTDNVDFQLYLSDGNYFVNGATYSALEKDYKAGTGADANPGGIQNGSTQASATCS